MRKVLNFLDGKKVYLGCVLGACALVCHKLGIPMPGITVDDSAVMQNLYVLAMVAAGRSAMPDKKGN